MIKIDIIFVSSSKAFPAKMSKDKPSTYLFVYITTLEAYYKIADAEIPT